MRGVWAIVALGVLCLGQAQAASPPASAFGQLPQIEDAAISPDGRHVALYGGPPGHRALSIATIDQPGLPSAPLADLELTNLRWVGNDYVLLTYADWLSVNAHDSYRIEHNIAVRADVQAMSKLLGGQPFADLVSMPVLRTFVGPPARALILGLAPASSVRGAGLWFVDPVTGRGQLADAIPGQTMWAGVDETGRPETRYDFDGFTERFEFYTRGKTQSRWTLVDQNKDWDPLARKYLTYSGAHDAIYIRDGLQILEKPLASGSARPVTDQKAPDLSLVWDFDRDLPVATRSGADVPSYTWIEPDLGAVQGALAKAFPGRAVFLYNWSSDKTRFVVKVMSRSAPTDWYLFDKARKELSPLGDEYPELAAAPAGATRAVSYKARDGLEIQAYLTLPAVKPTHGAPPLIVVPHDDLHSRDPDRFDFLVQFLASRGYAVLQPEYRGSWGYGDTFEDAANGEWGGKVGTDLVDGIAAVGAMGAADSSRVCIVGRGFGGYLALSGVAMQPASYRCAVSISGLSDLGLFLADAARATGTGSKWIDYLRHQMGDVPRDQLLAMSPAKQAARIQAPVLLIHGEQDTAFRIAHAEMMDQAMREAGKPVEFVRLEKENGNLAHASTRIQALQAIDTFLAKNLPVTP